MMTSSNSNDCLEIRSPLDGVIPWEFFHSNVLFSSSGNVIEGRTGHGNVTADDKLKRKIYKSLVMTTIVFFSCCQMATLQQIICVTKKIIDNF